MRTKIKEYNGEHVALHFAPQSPQEEKMLAAFKMKRGTESVEHTVTSWVENALENEGLGQHAVLDFEGIQNNYYHIFKVQRI